MAKFYASAYHLSMVEKSFICKLYLTRLNSISYCHCEENLKNKHPRLIDLILKHRRAAYGQSDQTQCIIFMS